MKKTIFTAVVLLASLTAQAQKSVSIAPTLKVGMQKTYTTHGEGTSPGAASADVTGEITYNVASKTADGYLINLVSKASNIDTDQMTQALNTPDIIQMLTNSKVELLTDKKGGITRLGNAQELIDKCNAVIDSLFTSTLNKSAELKDNAMVQNSMKYLTSTMKEMLTEDYILESIRQMPSIISLNGKTISDGMQEQGTYAQLFKTTTTYSLLNGGKTIQEDTKADVDMESMKAYLLKMLKGLLPESVTQETNPEELTRMIETMVSEGNMKLDMNRHATYDIGDDGWVKKLVFEMEMNVPGQTSKVRQVISQKL